MVEIEEELAEAVRRRVGQLVCGGRYSIEHVLGIGGMAAVYAGVHRNGRHVALKFLHPELSRRGDIRKRFLREGQAANAVQHPGVVAVIDDDVAEDGSAFLVMERLEGKSLEHIWEELGRRLPVRVVLTIGRELCEVLAIAHRAGIYHRDLKPENLFLTNDGRLKVLDFGLAHLRDATRPKDTHTGMVFGTPAFMPPEQASGETSKIDARTDVWAIGATLFTLLSGELVHRGETAQHFVMLAAMEPARSLAAAMPHAHPVLVELVDRALARDRESRWQSAEAMHERILACMDLILGDHEIALPTSIALAEMAASQMPRDASPESSFGHASTKPNSPKLPAIEQMSDSDETFSDRTSVDARFAAAPDSSPDTEPGAPKPMAVGTSDTPTEQTTPDELPTQVRTIDDPVTVQRSSARLVAAIDPSRRASWSDLRRAIGEEPGNQAEAPAGRDETQLLVAIPATDRTQVLGRDLRPSHAAARAPAPSAPAFAISHDRRSYQAPLLAVQRRRADTATQKTRIRLPHGYLPIVGAAALLGLSPLAYFIARNWNVAPAPAPSFSTPVTSNGETAPAPLGSVEDRSRAGAAAEPPRPAASSVALPMTPPVLTPSVPPADLSARDPTKGTTAPVSAASSAHCAQPLRVDPDGIKRWRPECLP